MVSELNHAQTYFFSYGSLNALSGIIITLADKLTSEAQVQAVR